LASKDRQPETEESLDETGIGRSVELRPGGQLGGSELEAPVDADFPAFRRLTFLSVVAGACAFLPATFHEDRAFTAVCSRMVVELGKSRDLALAPEEVHVLAAGEDQPSTSTRAAGWLQRLARRPFPRLAVHNGVQRAVEAFGRGYLLLHAAGLEMAELHPPDRTPARVHEVRAAIDATLGGADDHGLRKAIAPAFHGGARLLLRAADVLAGFLGQRTDPVAGVAAGSGALTAEDRLLGTLVDRIADALWSDREGLAGLEKSFEIHLARLRGSMESA